MNVILKNDVSDCFISVTAENENCTVCICHKGITRKYPVFTAHIDPLVSHYPYQHTSSFTWQTSTMHHNQFYHKFASRGGKMA